MHLTVSYIIFRKLRISFVCGRLKHVYSTVQPTSQLRRTIQAYQLIIFLHCQSNMPTMTACLAALPCFACEIRINIGNGKPSLAHFNTFYHYTKTITEELYTYFLPLSTWYLLYACIYKRSNPRRIAPFSLMILYGSAQFTRTR